MKLHIKLSFLLFMVFLLFFAARQAYAYFDPGAGSMYVQAIIAAIAAVGAAIGLLRSRIKAFFNRIINRRISRRNDINEK